MSDPLFGSFPQGRQMDAPGSSFGEVLPDATPELLAWARRRFEELDEAVTGIVAARSTTGATRVAAQLPVQSGPFSTIGGWSPTLGGRSGSGGSGWIALGYDPLRPSAAPCLRPSERPRHGYTRAR